MVFYRNCVPIMPRGKKSGNQESRASNWRPEEKELLIELVSEKISVIENKKSDANATKRKNIVWRDIVQKFCSVSTGAIRDERELREQWKRLKAAAKNEVSNYKKELKRTGGGPEPKPPSDLTNKIKDLLPNDFEQTFNQYDDDFEELHDTDSQEIENASACSEINEEDSSMPQSPSPAMSSDQEGLSEDQGMSMSSSAPASSFIGNRYQG